MEFREIEDVDIHLLEGGENMVLGRLDVIDGA